MTVDKIEQTIDLPFPQDRVWRAITNPEEVSRWFSDKVTMKPDVGSKINFVWNEFGSADGVVEQFDPPTRFAYRWRATGVSEDEPLTPNNSTLVTFTLTPTAKGTRLELIESGFASLPEAIREKSYQDNTGGWKSELGDLVEYLETEN
ncbi:MAG: SRPBCC family protein [Candidatus Promineifilaceae bacterium]